MSLRGRRFFDVLQHHPSSPLNTSRFRLPCPPYDKIEFWDRMYKDMDSDDVHEWGGFDLHGGLLQFRYETVLHLNNADCDGSGSANDEQHEQQHHQDEEGGVHTSTFAEYMGISQWLSPEEAIERYEERQTNTNNNSNDSDGNNESILLLGCGNSKVGEQILMNSFVGPVLQVDISSKVIHLMKTRYSRYLAEASVKRMEFIVDDARGLTSLSPESVGGGVLDKGLIDVLHCSTGSIDDNDDVDDDDEEEENPIPQIVDSVHRVLQPSRPFIFFSRSNPEYILRRTLGTVHWDTEIGKKWKDVEVIRLVDFDLLLYRFTKADILDAEVPPVIRPRQKKKKRRR